MKQAFSGENLVGKCFGLWSVLSFSHFCYALGAPRKQRKAVWYCQCACGSERCVEGPSLRGGSSLSCGCQQKAAVRKAATTHGLYGHPIYSTWQHMHQRCYNKNNRNYHHYGAKGITICQRWHSFERFFEDMSPTWSRGMSIERRSNKLGYFRANCLWIPRNSQPRNTSQCIWITYRGERKILADWARELGIHRGTIMYRLNRGLSIGQVFKKSTVQLAQ